MMKIQGVKVAGLVAVGAFLAAAPALGAPSHFPTTAPVRFIIVGDTGTGESGEYAVATGIGAVCAQRTCQFAIALGDNIYEYGAADMRDPQFQEKFEKPFARLDFPFFLALGNHDQSGLIPGSGVHPERGDHEVEYTQLSAKWMMPSRYYRFGAPFASATDFYAPVAQPVIEFFAIDTNYLAPQDVPPFDWYRPGREYDLAQRAWLRDGLAASRAPWKVVFGHHPDRNNGAHGNAGAFFGMGLSKGEDLKKMYEEEVCGKADLLVAGHDHSLQWLTPQASCGDRTHFLISGAGAKTYFPYTPSTNDFNPVFWETFGTLGFFWAEATADGLTIAAYTVDEKGIATRAFEKTLRK